MSSMRDTVLIQVAGDDTNGFAVQAATERGFESVVGRSRDDFNKVVAEMLPAHVKVVIGYPDHQTATVQGLRP